MRRVAAVFAFLLIGLACDSAGAQALREEFRAPNGAVYALALSGNTLYLGGEFTYLGPMTGGVVVRTMRTEC